MSIFMLARCWSCGLIKEYILKDGLCIECRKNVDDMTKEVEVYRGN